jgi:hypothetical protein
MRSPRAAHLKRAHKAKNFSSHRYSDFFNRTGHQQTHALRARSVGNVRLVDAWPGMLTVVKGLDVEHRVTFSDNPPLNHFSIFVETERICEPQ